MEYYQTFENFLHPIQQQILEKYIYSNSDITWSYQHNFERKDEAISIEMRRQDENIIKPNCGIFYHNLVEENVILSKHFDVFSVLKKSISAKLKIETINLLRMRINLSLPYIDDTERYTSPHFDYPGPNYKTLIYYVTGNEGDTVLFQESFLSEEIVDKKTVLARIKPKKGKAILFDSNRYHAMCMSRTSIRSVVNVMFS